MTKGSIDSFETFSTLDGPGIRTVVFLNGCKLRCLFCHNPEMWNLKEKNFTPEEVVQKILRNKPYFKNGGGVTFSGGEPLLQIDFLIETCKLLKRENIHITLDTAGVGLGDYDEILSLVDLVIFDIKALDDINYMKMTGNKISESLKFLECCQKNNKKMWIRQVIVPGINDSEAYIDSLAHFIKKLKNIEKIELLPFHTMAYEKYKKLNLDNRLKDKVNMDKEKCNKLEKILLNRMRFF